MSLQSVMFNIGAAINDYKHDKAIPLPDGITQCRNISYGSHGKWNLLDVYYPDGTTQPLPTIVSIHGGGYVYGTKEIYRRYGMDMARRGFAFVNFNYRLAPKWRFPAPLWDTNAVMEWICKNAVRYHLDPNRIIIVGDSAGAQLASQYAAIAKNPDYAAAFHMKVPEITIRALGLNCGMYDIQEVAANATGIARDYMGKDFDLADPRLKVLEAIGADYPPAHITTAHHDFLKEQAQPMYDFLTGKGIRCRLDIYGSEDDKTIGHVFHVTITQPEAIRCNDDAAAFFKEVLEA
ncbi:MAG: alpha/beta hydrolase [Oscillospiraceae bacterium]|nr:alpha/beta hydrolase [Oscillospiraceae bacterium]